MTEADLDLPPAAGGGGEFGAEAGLAGNDHGELAPVFGHSAADDAGLD